MATIKTLSLVMGNAQIPIKVKSNGHSSNKLSFNNLHKEDKGRVGYKKYCKECGKEVDKDEIMKGYKLGDDYIEIDKGTIKQAKQKSKGDRLKVLGKINKNDLDLRLVDGFYYIDSKDEFEEEYATLQEALSLKGITLICSFVYRKKEKIVAVESYRGNLVMFKLKNPNLLKDSNKVVDNEAEPNEEAVKSLASVFECFSDYKFENYENEYNKEMKEIIKKKSKGEKIEVKKPQKTKESKDFLEDLKQTEEMMKKQKVEA